MTKRMITSALLALAVVAPATGAQAASLNTFKLISVYYQSGTTVVSAGGLMIEDLTGNNPPVFSGSIYVSTQAGTDSGSGPLDVVLDPLGNVGRLSGSVAGSFGQLSVDLVFAGTQQNSANLPSIGADVSPMPEVIVSFFWNRFGHAVGSATSAFGTVDVPNSSGYAATGIGLVAP